MSSYNTRIVRRSNALQDWTYGHQLRYREVVGFGRRWTAPLLAGGMTVGLAVVMGALQVGPVRGLLRWVLPAPGEGLDARTRERGHFSFDLHACSDLGARSPSTAVRSQHGI